MLNAINIIYKRVIVRVVEAVAQSHDKRRKIEEISIVLIIVASLRVILQDDLFGSLKFIGGLYGDVRAWCTVEGNWLINVLSTGESKRSRTEQARTIHTQITCPGNPNVTWISVRYMVWQIKVIASGLSSLGLIILGPYCGTCPSLNSDVSIRLNTGEAMVSMCKDNWMEVDAALLVMSDWISPSGSGLYRGKASERLFISSMIDQQTYQKDMARG